MWFDYAHHKLGGEIFMTEAYRSEPRFRHPNIRLQADATIVPCANFNKGERYPVTFAPFPDHGAPLFVASTISSNTAFVEAASQLSRSESEKIDEIWQKVAIQFSIDRTIMGSASVLSSKTEGKPDIHVFIIGDPYSDNSLRLYCHKGILNGIPAIIQDARGRKKDAERIEKQFRQNAQYKPPKAWNSRKGGK